jgi:hypothetical protein
MKKINLVSSIAAISSVVLGATLVAQNQVQIQTPNPVRKLTKIGSAQSTPLSADGWREQISDSDLDAREQAFDRLVDAARKDADLRKTLHAWADDRDAGELAWTARLALRELDSASSGRGFHAFALPGGAQGFQFPAPFDPNEFFQQFDQIDPQSWPGFDLNGSNFSFPGGNGSFDSQAFSLKVGPDGVKCTVKHNVDGKEVTEEYEAESIDKLLEAHPELSDKIHSGSGSFQSPFFSMPGRQGNLLRVHPLTPLGKSGGANTQSNDTATDESVLRTDILGVVVQPLSEQETSQLDLDSGVGLRIERVVSGTIARSMGLQSGHVLVEMNGRTIHGLDDITEELKKRGSDGGIECVVIDRWGQRRTHAWKPNPSRQL